MLRTLDWSSDWRFSITAVDCSKSPSWAKERICSNFGLATPLKTWSRYPSQLHRPSVEIESPQLLLQLCQTSDHWKGLIIRGTYPSLSPQLRAGSWALESWNLTQTQSLWIFGNHTDWLLYPYHQRRSTWEIDRWFEKYPRQRELGLGRSSVSLSRLPPELMPRDRTQWREVISLLPPVLRSRWYAENVGVSELSMWKMAFREGKYCYLCKGFVCSWVSPTTHIISPMRIRLVKKCHRSTGSCVCLWVVKNHSQHKKPVQNTKRITLRGEDHALPLAASCKAETRKIDPDSSNPAPTKSTFLCHFQDNVSTRLDSRPWLGKLVGNVRRRSTMERQPAGTLGMHHQQLLSAIKYEAFKNAELGQHTLGWTPISIWFDC